MSDFRVTKFQVEVMGVGALHKSNVQESHSCLNMSEDD